MAADIAGMGVRAPEFMFTAACTPLILRTRIAGCMAGLQPVFGVASINSVQF
jgi:hypothetical protein